MANFRPRRTQICVSVHVNSRLEWTSVQYSEQWEWQEASTIKMNGRSQIVFPLVFVWLWTSTENIQENVQSLDTQGTRKLEVLNKQNGIFKWMNIIHDSLPNLHKAIAHDGGARSFDVVLEVLLLIRNFWITFDNHLLTKVFFFQFMNFEYIYKEWCSNGCLQTLQELQGWIVRAWQLRGSCIYFEFCLLSGAMASSQGQRFLCIANLLAAKWSPVVHYIPMSRMNQVFTAMRVSVSVLDGQQTWKRLH